MKALSSRAVEDGGGIVPLPPAAQHVPSTIVRFLLMDSSEKRARYSRAIAHVSSGPLL